MPSVGATAPMTPQLPMAQTTNLSQQRINDIGNQAVRAYVIESDVTSNQEELQPLDKEQDLVNILKNSIYEYGITFIYVGNSDDFE